MEGGEPPGGRPANHFICQPIDTNNEVSANPEKKQSMQPSMDRLLPLEPAASRGPTTAAAATAAPVPGPGPRHGRCPRPLSPAAVPGRCPRPPPRPVPPRPWPGPGVSLPEPHAPFHLICMSARSDIPLPWAVSR